jgi:hypothetical protein
MTVYDDDDDDDDAFICSFKNKASPMQYTFSGYILW